MWGYKDKITKCPNCGSNGWEDEVKDFECPVCGFHRIETTDLGTSKLIYCEKCGNHYTDGCPTHEEKDQKSII